MIVGEVETMMKKWSLQGEERRSWRWMGRAELAVGDAIPRLRNSRKGEDDDDEEEEDEEDGEDRE